ncbi:uracil phosphoribosyltransferase [Treponema paraluiscuniculi Cuniculi A]|uniref:Uracil phosphoribosyltransferase n=3 Tax=Treponema paraluiscuniculi TaxID=53435 RepID=F7XSQ7_TREPU|nr:uracil phosphoribosyltransferase [Treponema paraluiscuniculi]AEH40390.1 uracil phosphoribosyltransferase [Treponema paraluiscuniculi Cuniculi A]WKC72318.1 uracil phosphoribosyltransferase [Treponema paraluiscuniculi]
MEGQTARRVITEAKFLDDCLTERDNYYLSKLDELYSSAMSSFAQFEDQQNGARSARAEENIIATYDSIGNLMQEICKELPALKVYSFETQRENHAEVSRVVSKLRNIHTGYSEFIYYTQRAFEMLFRLAYGGSHEEHKTYLITKTPVAFPVQNYAVHKIANVDYKIENTVMCVMLRGALLPSMIVSKEIEEYSSHGYVTPFALFKIKRDDLRDERDMQYVFDLDKSYFSARELDGKDLVFADPMNATGGSLVTIVRYLQDLGVKPKSISCFHMISALKGAIRVVRSLENCTVYTLWMDPVLNARAYIMPGLGDAGDRVNGVDVEDHPRNIIQLLADYGSNISGLYRSQLRKIEETVLGSR